MTDQKSNEYRELCDYFVSVAKVSDDGDKIKVGQQEAQYKWRWVYGLKAQWESYVPLRASPRSLFYPLNFNKDDRKGVIEHLASKEADRVLEERAQKARGPQSPAA